MPKTRESLEAQQKAEMQTKKQRPILFQSEMVQAILNGSKTETRRTTKLDPINKDPYNWNFNHFSIDKGGLLTGTKHAFMAVFTSKDKKSFTHIKTPYGRIDDILWVRETYKFLGITEDGEVHIQFKDGQNKYLIPELDREDYWNERLEKLLDVMAKKDKVIVDEENERYTWKEKDVPFKPSIHMPKEAARIWLQITSKRVERLLEIHDIGAIAEGVKSTYQPLFSEHRFKDYVTNDIAGYRNASSSFKSLWELINGVESVKSNPFVWVVQFKRIENPNA